MTAATPRPRTRTTDGIVKILDFGLSLQAMRGLAGRTDDVYHGADGTTISQFLDRHLRGDPMPNLCLRFRLYTPSTEVSVYG